MHQLINLHARSFHFPLKKSLRLNNRPQPHRSHGNHHQETPYLLPYSDTPVFREDSWTHQESCCRFSTGPGFQHRSSMREASDGDELGTAGNASAGASPLLRCDSEQQQHFHPKAWLAPGQQPRFQALMASTFHFPSTARPWVGQAATSGSI